MLRGHFFFSAGSRKTRVSLLAQMRVLVHKLRRSLRRYLCCCCCCCARAEEERLRPGSSSSSSDVLGAGAGAGKFGKMLSKRRGRTSTATVVELAAAKDALDNGAAPGANGAAAPPLASLSPGHSEASLKSPPPTLPERPANVTAAREAAQAAIDPDAWADS